MKKYLLYALVFFCIQDSFSQLIDNLTIGLESNAIWYNDDKQTGPFFDDANNDSDEHFRSNSYLKLDYTFLDNFLATVQFESYEPLAILNYSPSFNDTNIATYSLNYKSKKLDISAGHFYEQFGSGLILRSWEDRQLGLNNAILGGKITYTPTNFLLFTALYGNQREGFKTSDGEIYGFNAEIDLTDLLKFEESSLSIGGSYVGRKEDLSFDEDPNFNELTDAFSTRLDFSHKNFYSSLEYVTKSDDGVVQFGQTSNSFIKDGNALQINTGFAKKGLGVDLTFRRMENMSYFSEREKKGNVFNENVINYVPALTKQHDYLLANIYVYQAQPNVSFPDPSLLKAGEIGGQADIFYDIKKGTSLGGKNGMKLALNLSYWANLSGDYDFNNFDYDTDFFGFGQKYYSDISLEVRKKWNRKWYSVFYYVNQYYNKKFVEETNGKVETNIGIIETIYRFGNSKSLRFVAQHLWAEEDLKSWAGAVLEYNFNSRFSIYTNDIYNYGNDDEDSRIHYFNFGGSYTKGATRIALNYGRQRGGLLCVGGVCRFVAESTGLSASISMAF